MKAIAASGHPRPVEDGRDRTVGAQTVAIGDLELVARCRAGDRSAWRALHDANLAFVWKVARRLGTPREELDDVVQETFLIAFGKLDRFDHGQFRTWLYRIAANVASARHRRRRIRRAIQSVFGGAEAERAAPRTPLEDVQAREAEEQVAEVLERMSPKKREVFALFELEGLSGEEIARRVGCPVDTVWTRLHHARKEFHRIARKRGYLG